MIIIVVGIIVTLVLASLFWASYSIQSGVYVKSICRLDSEEEVAALTYDDGVHPDYTPQLLDLLDEYGAKATFFVIGREAAKYPELVKEIVSRGHKLGNHSYDHKWSFPMQSVKDINQEITACNKLLESITGQEIKIFRPPFGVTNPTIAKALRATGYQSIGWNIRSLDTCKEPADIVATRVLRKLKANDIVLLHDNRPQVVDITRLILKGSKLKFVSVD